MSADHSVVSSDEMLEIILRSIRKLIDYELAVVLKYDGRQKLYVKKAIGPLAGSSLRDYSISLVNRKDIARLMEKKKPHLFANDENHIDTYAEIINLPSQHSCLVSPLVFDNNIVGLMTFDHRSCNRFNIKIIEFIEAISTLIAALLVQFDISDALAAQTKVLLDERNNLLSSESEIFRNLIGNSAQWIHLLDSIKLVAGTGAPVLILGETGTGKEEIARAIHRLSTHAEKPFVPVNCSALSSSLAESELFGHEKGSFTGAIAMRKGRFELADKGTLFLDEVGDLPLDLQPKLLRVLADGIFERVGGEKSVKVDVRIIAATNVDLEQAIQKGNFREDLYYRLSVFPIIVPPLRQRSEDIELIALHILNSIKQRTNNPDLRFSKEALQEILSYPWPGNVRELKNVLERSAILAGSGEIRREHLGLGLTRNGYFSSMSKGKIEEAAEAKNNQYFPVPSLQDVDLSLETVIKKKIEMALEASGGKIYGNNGAAAALNLKPSTLQSKMKKLGIQRDAFKKS